VSDQKCVVTKNVVIKSLVTKNVAIKNLWQWKLMAIENTAIETWGDQKPSDENLW
jgi:hypothetical protein